MAYCWRVKDVQTGNNAQQSSKTSAPAPFPTYSGQTTTKCSPSTSTATVNESHIGAASGSDGPVETKKRPVSTKLNSSFISINEKGKRSFYQSDACSGDYLIDMRIYLKADLPNTGDLEDFSRLACTQMNLWCRQKEICFSIAKDLERKAMTEYPKTRVAEYAIIHFRMSHTMRYTDYLAHMAIILSVTKV